MTEFRKHVFSDFTMTISNTNESRPHPMVGAQLGQYKILDMVGGGGMGMVFRARQETVDRNVAIKLLPPGLAHDEINTKRLEREAKALAKLNHPNIVTTFDFGLTEYGQAYLVMELVDGESLKELLLREGRIEVARALKIFVQLADAMRFAHNTGIIHRDLKPHNVMLATVPSPDFVKVLDFGIATLADSQKLTRAGEIIGSPLYMSPEQCLSDPVDARSDIYSFGILMYLCLTGSVPFKGDTLYETVERKCTQEIPRFKDIAPHVEVPQFLEELIRHCIAVEPRDRFQTMDEVKDLLASISVSNKKAATLESTAAFGTGAPAASQAGSVPAKTIKERMAEASVRNKSDSSSVSRLRSGGEAPHAGGSAPGSSAAGTPTAGTPPAGTPTQGTPPSGASLVGASDSRPSASRPSASRPIKSRQTPTHRGIVLTPGVMVVGFLVILGVLFAGVVVGIYFVNQGSLIPIRETANSDSKPDTSPNSIADTSAPVTTVDTGTARDTDIAGDTSAQHVTVLETNTPRDTSITRDNSDTEVTHSSDVKLVNYETGTTSSVTGGIGPKSGSTRSVPEPGNGKKVDSVATHRPTTPKASRTDSTQKRTAFKRVHAPPAKKTTFSAPREHHLPTVRHTVPAVTDSDRWYNFNR